MYAFISISLMCLLTPISAAESSTAKNIFQALNNQVYQIRVIDIASGDKYSIGSGFQIH